MIRSEYMVMLDDWFIIDCCEERKKVLESEGWRVEVLIAGENLATWDRHCCMKPCLMWRKDAHCE